MRLPADVAIVGRRLFVGLEELTSDLDALDTRGAWVAVVPFDGPPTLARFASMTPAPPMASLVDPVGFSPTGTGRVAGGWASSTGAAGWASSTDRAGFVKGVSVIRDAIAAGDYYQVNLCRRLRTPLPTGFDVLTLGAALEAGNPAPHAATVRLPSAGVFVASASPERFLARRGDLVVTEPIKGTAATSAGLGAKDIAENVMIVDLMRNDLGRVCRFGSVEVPSLCRVELHPGLAHLVSTVSGRLRPGVGWRELLGACFPPGSVTGAPKLAALEAIRALEPGPRGVYCGAVGWVDADRGRADLNVAIRTFWAEEGFLHLGTGGGITCESDAQREWDETELKVARLLAVAGAVAAGAGGDADGGARSGGGGPAEAHGAEQVRYDGDT